jgi:hypothetical protein
MKEFCMYRVGIFTCPHTGILRINVSRQVKPRLVREPSDSGHTCKDFPKYGVPSSVLSGCKWWPLPSHVMMSSYFLHNEVSPLEISLQYPH